MARVCAVCQAPIADQASFCSACGRPAASSPDTYAAPYAPAASIAHLPYAQVPAYAAPAYGAGASKAALAGAGQPAGLTVSPPLQTRYPRAGDAAQDLQLLQQKVITQGDSIAAAFGHEPTGIVKVISWMVRATFLDTRVASAAANDVNGNLAAILALLITYLPGLVFTSLLTALFTMRLGALLALFTGLAVIAVSLLVALLVMSALSVKILQVKLPAAVLLRTLAYAQTALIVGAIPLLGGFIGPVARIWSIAASAVAVREAASASAEKATIFVVIGVVIQVTLGMALSVLATRAGLM